MFKIIKNEPEFFKKAKNKIERPKTSKSWGEIGSIRKQLRTYILKNEQHSVCAYCETKLTEDNSNIDHFKTRHKYPDKTLEYDNLLVSCKNDSRCSSHKDQNINNKEDYDSIINPVIENPDDFIDYSTLGRIIAIDENKKAKYTIDIFQLHTLNDRRKRISAVLYKLNNMSLGDIDSVFDNEFKSFTKNVLRKLNKKDKK